MVVLKILMSKLLLLNQAFVFKLQLPLLLTEHLNESEFVLEATTCKTETVQSWSKCVWKKLSSEKFTFFLFSLFVRFLKVLWFLYVWFLGFLMSINRSSDFLWVFLEQLKNIQSLNRFRHACVTGILPIMTIFSKALRFWKRCYSTFLNRKWQRILNFLHLFHNNLYVVQRFKLFEFIQYHKFYSKNPKEVLYFRIEICSYFSVH